MHITTQKNILIVAVTPVERQAIIDAFKELMQCSSKVETISDRSYRHLGSKDNAHFYMAVSEMGSGGIGGSHETVRKAIEALNPSSVVMVGIAFGVNKDKQSIGDVLVAKQILAYELQRVDSKITSRGDKTHTSANLINWLTHAHDDWPETNCKVDFGLILSGEKLVDSLSFRNELIGIAPDSIGGEMEGTGLYVACQDAKLDWILVKAICDWADGNKGKNKKKNQAKAAKNAATFITHAIGVSPIPGKNLSHSTLAITDEKIDRMIALQEHNGNQILHGIEVSETNILKANAAALSTVIEAMSMNQRPDSIPTSNPLQTQLIDEKIQIDVLTLRKGRNFPEFPREEYAIRLGNSVQSGELSTGTTTARSYALAWCARVLDDLKHESLTQQFLNTAQQLGDGEEVNIAKAFKIALHGNIDGALGLLAQISSATARSAAFIIQKKYRDAELAVEWLASTSLTFTQLDSDGKLAYVCAMLDLHKSEQAYNCFENINAEDFEATPALVQIKAVATYMQVVPEQFRSTRLEGVPLNACSFPLASDGNALNLRKRAAELFSETAKLLRNFDCEDTANNMEDFGLWIELRDPDANIHANAKERLRSSMGNPKSDLRLANLALQFGLTIDIEALERKIGEVNALTGGNSLDAALARFAIVLYQKSAKATVDYIDRHREQLYRHLNKELLKIIEVEALANSGLIHQAEKLLRESISTGLDYEESQQLQIIIDGKKGIDQIAPLKAAFTKSDSINDLRLLTQILEEKCDWPQLGVFAKILFDRTKSLADAKVLVRAKEKNKQFDEIEKEVFRKFPEFLDQSEHFLELRAFILYRKGAFQEANTTLSKLRSKRENSKDRQFRAELAITSGNWEDLWIIAKEELEHQDNRSAEELIRAAKAAYLAGSPKAKELMYAAANKGSDDPNILFAAYLLASEANWESDPKVFSWMQNAARLSGETGPIRTMSLEDIVTLKPTWDKTVRDTSSQITNGTMPLWLAGTILNQSLVQLILIPSLINPDLSDVRRRRVIPSYSGARQTRTLKVNNIIVDATVLLNLARLNLLGVLKQSFQKISIPHSTLRWLYQEKKKSRFHQPSQISKAKKIIRLVADKSLNVFESSMPINRELAEEIGDDLAQFLTEAKTIGNGESEGLRKYVVVSQPVYQVSSFMKVEVDLSAYSSQVCSCISVLNKLVQKAQIGATDANIARTYLGQHSPNKSEPNSLPDNSILYLEDVCLTYLEHAGLLQRLKNAGLKAYISQSEYKRAEQLANSETVTDKVVELIEIIREFIVKGMESGKIQFEPMPDIEDDNQDSKDIFGHPSAIIFRSCDDVDAIVLDDRAVNHHLDISLESGKTIALLTTSDLLNHFYEAKEISQHQLYEAKTTLRQAGYAFINITTDELQFYLNQTTIENQILVESLELKAIRENLLQIQIDGYLQLPQEAVWFDQIIKTLINTLKVQWVPELNTDTAKARSNWLLRLLDLSGWGLAFKENDGLVRLELIQQANTLLLLTHAWGLTRAVLISYLAWLDSAILVDLKKDRPEFFLKIVDKIKVMLSDTVSNLDKGDLESVQIEPNLLGRTLMSCTPNTLREVIFEDKSFREMYQLDLDWELTIGSHITIKQSVWTKTIRSLLGGKDKHIPLIDINGDEWFLKFNLVNEEPTIQFSRDKIVFTCPSPMIFSPHQQERLQKFSQEVREVNLPKKQIDYWRDILNARPLTDEEGWLYDCDCKDTPIAVARVLSNRIQNGECGVTDLVPHSENYFIRLIGDCDASSSVEKYVSTGANKHIKQVMEWNARGGFILSLILCSHPSITSLIDIGSLSNEDLHFVYSWVEKNGDYVSRVAAVEIGLSKIDTYPFLVPYLTSIINQLIEVNIDSVENDISLFSALIVFVDAELSRTQILKAKPPFWRRLAAITQAAVIISSFVDANIDRAEVTRRMLEDHLPQFYTQNLVDLRLEPRWHPDHILATQLKQEFIGRLVNIANLYKKNITDKNLYKLLFQKSERSLQSVGTFPNIFYVGPLEGGVKSELSLPVELVATIEQQLNENVLHANCFNALANASLIFDIDSRLIELTNQSLQKARYQIRQVRNKNQLYSILHGLATVAAVSRSPKLADDVIILLRIFMQQPKSELKAEEAIGLALVAGAAHSNLTDWCDFIGKWFTEISFYPLEKEQAVRLRLFCKRMCNIEPGLWLTCSRGLAALDAYSMSIH